MSSTNASSLVRTRPGGARRRITNTGANDVGREEEMGSLTAGTKRTQDRLSEIANGIGSGGVGSGNETARQKRKRMGEGVSESAVAGSQIGQMASSAMPGSLSSSSLVRYLLPILYNLIRLKAVLGTAGYALTLDRWPDAVCPTT